MISEKNVQFTEGLDIRRNQGIIVGNYTAEVLHGEIHRIKRSNDL